MVARESTETMMPSLNLKARVVVPLANLTSWCSSPPPQTDAKLLRQYSAGYIVVLSYKHVVDIVALREEYVRGEEYWVTTKGKRY